MLYPRPFREMQLLCFTPHCDLLGLFGHVGRRAMKDAVADLKGQVAKFLLPRGKCLEIPARPTNANLLPDNWPRLALG